MLKSMLAGIEYPQEHYEQVKSKQFLKNFFLLNTIKIECQIKYVIFLMLTNQKIQA